MKVGIIGAGISGLSAGQMLKDRAEVSVFEKAEKPGGLVKCENINGNLFHRVGGHVFNAKNREVFDWFWSFFNKEEEFLSAKRNAKILFSGKLIGYPFENYLHQLGKDIIGKVISELLQIQNQKQQGKQGFENFEEFLIGSFGNTLYNLYFKPYNHKIWQTDLTTVSLEWLEGKLPMPDIKEILLSNIIKEEEDSMVHSSFYYPKKNGSQFIADRLSTGLNIFKSIVVDKISEENKGYRFNNDMVFDSVIYTGDIRTLTDVLQTNNAELREALADVKKLKSNGTSNLLCECDENDISWLYIPEKFTRAHRIIYTGNFSQANNRGTKRKSCVVEFSGYVDPEEMKHEITKLPGNLSPLAHNYEPNSYVIQDKLTRNKIRRIKELLEPRNFFLLGRFAEWEYYNMDKAIEAAMGLTKRIII